MTSTQKTIVFRSKFPRVPCAGFTLVEVVVALGLFVFAITVLIGVIPSGMQQVQTASNEGLAMTTMEAIRDDIRITLDLEISESPRFKIVPPEHGDSGPMELDFMIADNGEVSSAAALFRIRGTLRRPAATTAEPIRLHLQATWPAKAPAGRQTGNTELVSAFRP